MDFLNGLDQISTNEFGRPYRSLSKDNQAVIGLQILPDYKHLDEKVFNFLSYRSWGLIRPDDNEFARRYVADFIIKEIHIKYRDRPWTEKMKVYYQTFLDYRDDEWIATAIIHYLSICPGFRELVDINSCVPDYWNL